MTVASQVSRAGPYLYTGSTNSFVFEFKILKSNHIRVIKTDSYGIETILNLNFDYTVSGIGEDDGGVVYVDNAKVQVGDKITILRDVPIVQETDIRNQSGVYPSVIEDSLDELVMISQQLSEELSRAFKAPPSSELDIDVLYQNIIESGEKSEAASDLVKSVLLRSVGSISDLLGLSTTTTKFAIVSSFHTNEVGGGGVFFFDESMDKAKHNGGTIIDPGKSFPADWNNEAEKSDWFAAGEGLGCWIRHVSGEIDVKWFGAKGDGVSDNSKSFISAASSAASILVPNGEYLLSSEIVLANCSIHGEGDSNLVFTHGGNGLILSPTKENSTISVSSLRILTKDVNGGIGISTTKNSNLYYSNRVKYVIKDVHLCGYSNPVIPLSFEKAEAWATAIQISDSWNSLIQGCDITGNFRIDNDPVGQFISTGIKLEANGATLTSRITELTIHSCHTGVDIGEKSFFNISHIDVAHSYYGIYQSAVTAPFNESKITNTNINAQKYGIYFKGVDSREISGVIIRRHRSGWKGGGIDWYGIFLEDCVRATLNNIEIQPDENEGAFPETQYGIYDKGCSGLMVNNYGAGVTLDRAMLLDNSTMAIVENLATYQANGSTDNVFRLINNSRSFSFGKVTYVSTFKGYHFTDDGSIDYDNAIIEGQRGSWSPQLKNVAISYTTQYGKWQRIGKMVQFDIMIDYTGLNTSDTSYISIDLPTVIGIERKGNLELSLNVFASTGLNLSMSDVVHLASYDSSTDLVFVTPDRNRLRYNSGKLNVSGKIYISGSFRAAD